MSEEVAAPRLPAVIATRYVPIRVIGRGGMGVVYEVEHTRTGEHLALKVLLSTVDPSAAALERFKREARASARIKSEHVVRVIDADVAPELDGAPFLVMELLEGMDIEKAAGALRPTPATVVDWLRQAARAIDKAHRLGIVHRDLKPENLFLANLEDRAPIVKVLDFGIAKMAQEGAATGSGQVLGTPKYMAPEQAAGSAGVTAATDLFAMGMIAYRLIMEESYYREDDVLRILASLLHGQLEPPSARNPNFGAAFDAWFQKACDKQPEGRFASAAIQVEALAEALGLSALPIERLRDQPSPAHEPARPTRSRPGRGVLTFAAVALAVAVVVSVAVLFGSRSSRVATTPAAAPVRPAVPPSVAPKALATTQTQPQPSAPAPTALPIGARGTRRKSPTTTRAPNHGEGTKSPPSPESDPFRDQM